MILTREQAIAEHRKMWLWIAEETKKRKKIVTEKDYLKENGYLSQKIWDNCFCCEYAKMNLFASLLGLEGPCRRCPIDWESDENIMPCKKGYYYKWSKARDWEASAFYARIIAELPEKKNPENLEFTKEWAIKEHRKMWRWIAEETKKRKQKISETDYFEENKLSLKNIRNDSFCCEYAELRSRHYRRDKYESFSCEYCPIYWGRNDSMRYMCLDDTNSKNYRGYYYKWDEASDWKTAAMYANIIAELPEV